MDVIKWYCFIVWTVTMLILLVTGIVEAASLLKNTSKNDLLAEIEKGKTAQNVGLVTIILVGMGLIELMMMHHWYGFF